MMARPDEACNDHLAALPMTLIDRYLFRQLLGPAMLATAALSAVAVLSQSLSWLDLIVNQGQSAVVFVKITLLGVPTLISMILPISVFVSTLVALNRLHTEQEIVVCFAGGMSRWRVIAPAIRLACMAAIVSLVVNLWIQPLCARAMRAELLRVRTDLAATLVQEGQFTEPSPGLTVYARKVLSHGVLKNLFVNQEKPNGEASTYTALDGQIAERRGSPVLVMRHGSHQSLTSAGVLNYATFDEDIFDLSPYMPKDETVHYKTSDRYLHELFYPDLTQVWEQNNRLKLYAEGHLRLSAPLYNLAMVSLALAAVLGGSFSRLGYGRRIVTAAAIAAAVRIAGVGVEAVCDDNVWFNLLQYAVPLGAVAWGLKQVFRRPTLAAKTPIAPPSLRTATAGTGG
jgi:lipopolysaccharide export system permease protein